MEAKGKVKISEISEKMAAARGGQSSGRNRNSSSTKAAVPESKLVEGADKFDGQYSFRQEKKNLRGVPRWWEDRDTNEDGQISLAEYSTSRSASQRSRDIREFDKLDANHDGIITPTEAESVDD